MRLLTKEDLLMINKEEITVRAQALSEVEIEFLVGWLDLKDDNIRYQSFLLLQERSRYNNDVFPYWDIVRKKLKNDNSYPKKYRCYVAS